MKNKLLYFFNSILLLSLLFVLSACSLRPTYKSKREIVKYVKANYGNSYKLVEKKTYDDDSEEKNKMYEYVFKNKNDFSFSIFSSTTHIHFDASETAFYDSFLYDNYIERKIEVNRDKINNILNATNLSYTINKDYLSIDLNSFSEIDKISKALYEVQELLDFDKTNLTYDSSLYKIRDEIYVSAYLHSGTDKTYASTELKYGISESDIKNDFEKGFMNYAAQGNNFDKYDIPEEKISNFKIEKAIYEYDKYKHVTFYYDEKIDDYYTYDLSICLNYDIYDYNHNDNLQNLLTKRGGSFRRDGWTNTWSIGGNTFKATMTVDSKNNFKNLEIIKNGKKMDIQYGGDRAPSIFEQPFTLKTVEELLNTTITISKTGEVTIY